MTYCAGGGTGQILEAGAPDDTIWGYDMGTGDNGWGNGEEQYYTDRANLEGR